MTTNQQHAHSISKSLFELILILGTLLILKKALLSADNLWTYAGPLATLASLAVATWCLRKNNETWSQLGLKLTVSKRKIALWTVIAIVTTVLVDTLTVNILGNFLTPPGGAAQVADARFQGRFANVPGNLPVYLFWLALSWIIGGFAEEMLYRGALLSRFERLFAKIPGAVFIAIVLQAFIFGQQHYYYQGTTGFIATGLLAAVSGLLYLAFKRNLWPLIISHGLANSIGLTVMFLSPVATS